MKNQLHAVVLGMLCLTLTARAQPGPHFGGAMDKLFGVNQSFSATLEVQLTNAPGGATSVPGKIMFDSGKSRFEMDMTQAQGSQLSPQAAADVKRLGMDELVMIGRPDQKLAYMVYPGMQGYIESEMQDSESATAPNDFKVETTELGRETVDGHPCVKNKVVVTGKDGVAHVSTVWNATDLKNFPVKIQTTDQGREMTMIYRDISFAKPDASLFEPPAGYTKYNAIQDMMRAVIMKQAGGATGVPAITPPHN